MTKPKAKLEVVPEPDEPVHVQPVVAEQGICASCIYWKAIADKPGWGLCRCEPPVLLVWKGTPTFGTLSAWPECRGGDWCGKFVKK